MPRKPRVLFLFDIWVAFLGIPSFLAIASLIYQSTSAPSLMEFLRFYRSMLLAYGLVSLIALGLALRVRLAYFAGIVLCVGITAGLLTVLGLGLRYSRHNPSPEIAAIVETSSFESLKTTFLYLGIITFFLGGLFGLNDPIVEMLTPAEIRH